MKKCNNCGAQVADNASVCSVCGTSFAVNRASGKRTESPYETAYTEQPQTEKVIEYQTVYVPQPAVAQPDGKSKAIASLVLGLAGLIISVLAPTLDGIPAILGLLICIVGIVFGVKARNRIPAGVSGRGIATAGLTCSIIGAVISGIMTLAVVCLVVGVVALCAATPTASVGYYAVLLPFLF